MEPIHVVGVARTPLGAFLGSLSSLTAPQLGSIAIEAALKRAGVPPSQVGSVLLGEVLTAGVGQAPARQAALGAGLADNVPCTTISKVCGSGLEAIVVGAQRILLGDAEVVVAGGMESMSRAPHYLLGSRNGQRIGNTELVDGMILDGLWDPYQNQHMGTLGEQCARRYSLSRTDQDAFALKSYQRAIQAQSEGAFEFEISPVEVPVRRGPAVTVTRDEEPERAKLSKFASLKPAFDPQGSITAANASSVNDGAAAVVLASQSAVTRLGLRSLCRIVAYAGHAQAPEWFTTAPVGASQKALKRANLTADQVDLWEINEAFACVTMACTRDLGIDPECVNVHGGAVALGHPIGATGARLVVSLTAALTAREQRRGLASLCIGGGEALAVVLERG